MKFIPILALLLLTSCGTVPQVLGPSEIQSEFQEYVDRFDNEALLRGIQLKYYVKVQFGKTDPKFAAVCSFGNSTVTVNRDAWDDSDEIDRELLIFHELGHCVLKEGHVPEIGAIMKPDTLTFSNYYWRNRSAEIDRVFKERRDL